MSTRERLVDAALACVEEHGWEGTQLAAVRARAEVSNGSLYHFFSGRADLGAAVIDRAVRQRHEAFRTVLASAGSAAEGVTGVVREQQQWVYGHPGLARLLLGTPMEMLQAMADDTTMAAHQEFFAHLADWLRAQGWSGAPPFAVVRALWVGPALEYTLGWLVTSGRGDSVDEFQDATDALAAAAWTALEPILPGAS